MTREIKIGLSVVVAMLVTAWYLEGSHQSSQRDMKRHEDERTWRAVDSVKQCFAESLRVQLKPIQIKLDSLLHYGWLGLLPVILRGI